MMPAEVEGPCRVFQVGLRSSLSTRLTVEPDTPASQARPLALRRRLLNGQCVHDVSRFAYPQS